MAGSNNRHRSGSAVLEAELVETERIPPGDEPYEGNDEPPEPPEEDEGGDDDGPDEFESLEAALDELKAEVVRLRKGIANLRVDLSIQVEATTTLAAVLHEVSQKLGNLAGLQSISKLFGGR